MQEHAWKESRGQADWVVITAIDEHLWICGRDMTNYLQELGAAGVTCVPALGFDMNSEQFPCDRGLLIETVTRGRVRRFNKLAILNPDAVDETRFVEGRHSAAPTGRNVFPSRDELLLWHYKPLASSEWPPGMTLKARGWVVRTERTGGDTATYGRAKGSLGNGAPRVQPPRSC